MNIILLSGGSGKRLWPLSNDIRSKQFIKFLRKNDGTYESMVQRVFRQIKKVDKNVNVVVATSASQASIITNQLGDDIDISIEPCRKDTFPAITLACNYLKEKCHIDGNEPIIVCPIDSFVDDDYFKMFLKLNECIENKEAKLVLLGLKPTEPNEKYGYIVPKKINTISDVDYFKEKPSLDIANGLIARGALWNGGVFTFQLGYLLNKSHEILEYKDYQDLFNKYSSLEKISFDYAFVEKEKSIKVVPYFGKWKDIGTWPTLVESIDENCIGNAIVSDSCENVNVINELSMPIVAIGLKDVIISSSPEGLLVTSKKEASNIKPYVDQIDQRVMFAERSWGSYQIINIEDTSLTLKVILNPGHSMNYHSHLKRDEVWVIVSGKGKTIIDDKEQIVFPGDIVEIKAGSKHTIIANTQLEIIEVQLGKDISIFDKIKHELKR